MKLRRVREPEVKEKATLKMMAEEEAEEDDDNATLQECLDRHKKVTTVRNKSKRIALTPLDDEDSIPHRRKKSKGIHELLAADSAIAPRGGEAPRVSSRHGEIMELAKPKREGVETDDNVLQEGKKRKVKKKRRRSLDNVVRGGGNDENVLDDNELYKSAAEDTEDFTTSEFSRKIFIRIAKVELGDGNRRLSGGSPGFMDYARDLLPVEDVFLPCEGYHTCGDAENCSKLPCLEQILDYLDKMSEEQLKLWYKAITGEGFASRNGEKVRGRLRRMIKCKVKEIIRSQCPESTVSSQSWRGSVEAQEACADLSPPGKSSLVAESLLDSPGSNLSASNPGDGSGEAEDVVCSGKPSSKWASPASLSSSSETSREFTLQPLTSRKSFTKEASADSLIDDPESALQRVSPRITRSKARGLVKRSDTGQQDERSKDQCRDGDQDLSDDPAFCDASGQSAKNATAETAAAVHSYKESVVIEDDHKGVFPNLDDLPVECAAEETTAAPTRSPKGFAAEEFPGENFPSADRHLDNLVVESAVWGTSVAASRTRKKNFAVEKVFEKALSSADREVEGGAAEITAVATRSRKKKAVVIVDKVLGAGSSSADCNVTIPSGEAGAVETTTAAEKPCALDNVVGEVFLSADRSVSGRQVDGVAVQSTAAATRSRKKREIDAAGRVPGEVCSPADWNVSCPPVEVAAAKVEVPSAEPTVCATRCRKKSFGAEKVLAAVHSSTDRDLNGLLVDDGAAIETVPPATRSRKKRELVAAEQRLVEESSPADCDVSCVPVEAAAAAPTTAATRSRKKTYAVEKDPEVVFSPADCGSGSLVDVSAIDTTVAASRVSIAASRLHTNRGYAAPEEVLGEGPSSADSVLIDPPGEGEAAETRTAAIRSRKKHFSPENVLGEVSTSAGFDVDSLPEGVSAEETPVVAASSLDKIEAVAAEEVLGTSSSPADCNVMGPFEEGAAGETTTDVTRSSHKSFAVVEVLLEVSSAADCDVNGLLLDGEGGGTTAVATRSCTNPEFVGTGQVPEDVSTSAGCDVNDALPENAAVEPTNAVSSSSDNRELLASQDVLGEVSLSSMKFGDRSDKLDLAGEHSAQRFEQSCEAAGDWEESGLSLSEVIMKLLSDCTDKYSVPGRCELSAVGSQQSFEGLTRECGTQSSVSGIRMPSVEEVFYPHRISAAAPSTTSDGNHEKGTVETSDLSETHLSMPSELLCESIVSVWKQIELVEETFMVRDRDSCLDLHSKDCLSNFSLPMASPPWEEASLSTLEKSSQLCFSSSSDVVSPSVDVDDVRTEAPSIVDAQGHAEEVEHDLVTGAEQLQPCSASSSSPVVCRASSSGSVLEMTSDCKFSTEIEDFPNEDDDVSLLCQETTESSGEFVVADSVAFRNLYEDHVHLAPGRRLSGKHGCEQGQDMLSGTGDKFFFEQLSAEKLSSLWPARDEKEKYCTTRNDHEMDDVAESKSLCDSSTTCSLLGKWELIKCDSGGSKDESTGTFEVMSVPKVLLWRDAGEFLEDLDNVYMMLDTGRSFSSYSLRKRKYDESDLYDYTCEGPDDATQCDDEPPRTRQRVDSIAAHESCSGTGKLITETKDVMEAGGDREHVMDVEEVDVKNGQSIDTHTNVNAEMSAICEEVQDPVSSNCQQESWVDDHRRDKRSIVDDETAPLEKEMATNGKCSGPASLTAEVCLSQPIPCLGDSTLAEPPLCDSPESQSISNEEGSPESSDGSPELVGKSDACVDLQACEELVQEDREDFDQSSQLPVATKMEAMREDRCDESPSPPRNLPPIRLKLPSGRARHLASALTESKLRSARDWRYSEARAVGQEPTATTAHSSSPNSSDEDARDSIQAQETNVCESAVTEGRSCPKLSLVLSPTSPKSSLPPPRSNSSSSPQQENAGSPQSHVPPPWTARCGKGILKTSPKCKECVELRFQARTASDFVASQMKTFGEVAGRLTQEIQDLRSILETQVSCADERLQDDDPMQDTVKAISKSRDIERSAEKNLTLLLRDCKRFCKLTAKRPQRRIVFADEAGQKLCHVKTFQAPPALARPLWDIL